MINIVFPINSTKPNTTVVFPVNSAKPNTTVRFGRVFICLS